MCCLLSPWYRSAKPRTPPRSKLRQRHKLSWPVRINACLQQPCLQQLSRRARFNAPPRRHNRRVRIHVHLLPARPFATARLQQQFLMARNQRSCASTKLFGRSIHSITTKTCGIESTFRIPNLMRVWISANRLRRMPQRLSDSRRGPMTLKNCSVIHRGRPKSSVG